MNNDRPLQVGFIGAGLTSQVMHLHAFSRQPHARIACISDPRPNQCREVAAQFGATALMNYEEILNDPQIDAVVISVYRRCQASLARAALAAGKHVLSEKPMAYSVAEAHALAREVELSGRHYTVGHMRRFDAGVLEFRRTLHQMQQSGEMGELLYVHARDFCPTYGVVIPPHIRLGKNHSRYETSPFPEQLAQEHQADFDYSLNVISHDINLLHFLFGPIFRAELFAVRAGRLQTCVLSAPAFEVTLTAGLSNHGKWDQTVEIGFRHGRMLLHLSSSMDRDNPASYEIESPAGHQHRTGFAGQPWAFQAQAAHFINRCLGNADQDIYLDTSSTNGLFDLVLIEKLWGNVTWNR